MFDKCVDVLSGVFLVLDVFFVFFNLLFGGVFGRGGGEFRVVLFKKNIYILLLNIFYIFIFFYILIYFVVKFIYLKCVGLNFFIVEDDVFFIVWFYKFILMNSKKKKIVY